MQNDNEAFSVLPRLSMAAANVRNMSIFFFCMSPGQALAWCRHTSGSIEIITRTPGRYIEISLCLFLLGETRVINGELFLNTIYGASHDVFPTRPLCAPPLGHDSFLSLWKISPFSCGWLGYAVCQLYARDQITQPVNTHGPHMYPPKILPHSLLPSLATARSVNPGPSKRRVKYRIHTYTHTNTMLCEGADIG